MRTSGLTYDDLLQMFPEESLERHELIDGELFVTPAPSYRHQQVVRRILVALDRYAQDHGGEALTGPFDIKLSERDVVEPDVLWFSSDRRTLIEQRFSPVAPDLAIEISSPSTRRRDRTRKRALYERFDVVEYWFVDLEQDRIEVHRRARDGFGAASVLVRGDVLETSLLPGLTLDVDHVLGA